MLDQYDIQYGDSFTQFMELAVDKSDKVIVVLTPNYRSKSLERKGGVGYEQQIISGEIMSGIERKKFIPIIRNGVYENGHDNAIPPHFYGISTIDYRESTDSEKAFDELVRSIYEEPKLVKPTLGTKPNFETNNTSKNRSFILEFDSNYNCLQTDAQLTNVLHEIADLRKSNSTYNLEYKISGITDMYDEYKIISKINNPTDAEIERKLLLRTLLNSHFFLPNGTVYEYFNCAINSVIDYYFNKYKSITDYQSLCAVVRKTIQLFSTRGGQIATTNPFDVICNKYGWTFRIYISDVEVSRLLSKLGTDNKMMLTVISGFDLYDLSVDTIIDVVLPSQAYRFTLDFFQKKITDDLTKEYLKMGNWVIGLA